MYEAIRLCFKSSFNWPTNRRWFIAWRNTMSCLVGNMDYPLSNSSFFWDRQNRQCPYGSCTGECSSSFRLFRLRTWIISYFYDQNDLKRFVLAVLADFRGNDAVEVLTQIVQRINETTESDLSLKRHINQLRILTQLRNLELNLTTVMDSIASFFKEEKDFLYIRGQELIINNLLTNTDFSAEKIADLTGVSVDFVRTVQRKLTGKAD